MRLGAAGPVVGALLAIVVLAGCSAKPASADAKPQTPVGATATVAKGNLVEQVTKAGELGYGASTPLASNLGGTVTALAPEGSTVREGEVLYRIDTIPVTRLKGQLPAWRDLGSGLSDGDDVRQLKQALRDLGYGKSIVIDRHWDTATTDAVKTWQRALGVTATGVIPLGGIVFTVGDIRVVSQVAHLGDRLQPGAPVLQIGATTRVVTVQVDASQQVLAPIDSEVALAFPDGTATTGKVRAVSTTGGSGGDPNADGQQKLAVMIAPVDAPGVSNQLDGSSVQVTFHHVLATDVMTVPVGALVALAGGGYGVQKVGGDGTANYVAVTPGSFADVNVEVSSDALTPGDKVVVAP